MMKHFNKKIIAAAVLIMTIAIGSIAPVSAKKAHAIFGVGDTVIISADISPTGISNWTNSIAGYMKDYVLNTLINMFIKTLAHQITLSIVNWINSGFQGSPAFVSNPAGFFQNIGDNIAGNFIGGPGSPLAALCSPIALNVRLSIALDVAGTGSGAGNNGGYSCTLSSVVNNVKGASINGFVNGDFNQGGWPAFAALAQPQNTYYGAYVQSSADIAAQTQKQTALNKTLLIQGSGFLSFQTCTGAGTPQGSAANGSQALPSQNQALNIPSAPPGAAMSGTGGQNCQIQTPGSFISQQLNFAADSPLRQLDVADNINAIVSALMSQLVSKALQTGLAAVSGSHPGDASSYVTQIQAQETAQNNATAASLGQNLAASISQTVGFAQQVKNYVDSSLSLVVAANTAYQSASNYCTSVGDNDVVAQITNDVNTTINPLLAQLQAEDASSTNAYNNLITYQSQAALATSSDGLINSVGGVNGQSVTGGILSTTQLDVLNAQTENTTVQTTAASLNQKAAGYNTQCQEYAAGYNRSQ